MELLPTRKPQNCSWISFEKLPLAIAQAAAYIRETRISLGKYLELFRECEQNQLELLSQSGFAKCNRERVAYSCGNDDMENHHG
jgi:hypothetical protein